MHAELSGDGGSIQQESLRRDQTAWGRVFPHLLVGVQAQALKKLQESCGRWVRSESPRPGFVWSGPRSAWAWQFFSGLLCSRRCL